MTGAMKAQRRLTEGMVIAADTDSDSNRHSNDGVRLDRPISPIARSRG